MGVCFVAQTLSDDKIAAVLANPPLIWRLISPDDPRVYLKEIGQEKPPGFLARWLGRDRPWPPDIPRFQFEDDEIHELDMDKSWDGVNFCLKQLLPEQCANFFEDGQAVGRVEVGYGTALCFTSGQVADIAEYYCAISEERLLSAFKPAEMKQVYPKALWRRGDEDCVEYLVENFNALKTFLAIAERLRLGVLIQYC